MTEAWRPIALDPFGQCYEVSDRGRIRRSTPTHHGPAGRIRKLQWWGRHPKYLHVMLSADGVRGFFRVAPLVAITWIGPRPTPEHEVNHKNGNRGDNRVGNLEWVTNPENQAHAVVNRLHPRGERHGSAKLTEQQVREIRSLPHATERILAARYGVSDSTIYSVRARHTWRHIQ